MNVKEIQQDLTLVVNQHSLDSLLNLPDFVVAEYLIYSINALIKANKCKKSSIDEDAFIDRMYEIYPTKCPKRGVSLGKSRKDKERIRKLLKVYSMDEIERVFKHEIDEKFGKQYMQNFSTFLNNFPDPNLLDQPNLFVGVDLASGVDGTMSSLIIDGVIYK